MYLAKTVMACLILNFVRKLRFPLNCPMSGALLMIHSKGAFSRPPEKQLYLTGLPWAKNTQ